MKTIILIVGTIFTLSLKSQVDSILKSGTFGCDFDKNMGYIPELNKVFRKQLIKIYLYPNYFRNINSNIYSLKYTITKLICDDTTCKSGREYSYYFKGIMKGDSVAYSYYTDPLEKRHLLKADNNLMMKIKEEYKNSFGIKLDTSKLFDDNSVYFQNIGMGGEELSPEMINVITSIKGKKYKIILSYLKSPFPEDRLYGMLGVEIMIQKKVKIPIDVLKYYDIAKNTKGKAYECESDMCSLDDFQNLIKRIPILAKKIIEMHGLNRK